MAPNSVRRLGAPRQFFLGVYLPLYKLSLFLGAERSGLRFSRTLPFPTWKRYSYLVSEPDDKNGDLARIVKNSR